MHIVVTVDGSALSQSTTINQVLDFKCTSEEFSVCLCHSTMMKYLNLCILKTEVAILLLRNGTDT